MSKEFFYIFGITIALLCGHVGISKDISETNLTAVKYLHNPRLNIYVSEIYYRNAESHVAQLENKLATQSLVKAIELDPVPLSRRYQDFQAYRAKILSDPVHKEIFYSNQP